MAAATTYLVKGNKRVVVNVSGAFNTTDETATVLIDLSTLTAPSGGAPTSVRIDEITWSVGDGFSYVLLEWDHTSNTTLDYFQGRGYMDFRPYGGKNDPGSAGGTGDLVLTTSGGASGDTYSFLISATLKD